jgi:glycerophosphoryl diester phosphodiesterase
MIAVLLTTACGQPVDPTATASTEAAAPTTSPTPAAPANALPARLDCLRESGGVLTIGHRGGPTRDYPENAIETLQRTLDAGTKAMEIDVAETSDDRLVLMHDDDLDRTSTGTGLVTDHTLAEIQVLKLETGSKTTAFSPPTLEAALDWAVGANAVVELDRKRSATFPPVIAAVRAAKAENNVFVITYTDEQAIEMHTLAPGLVITATITSIAHLDSLLEKGVKADRLIAWTGTTKPDPDLWQALRARGVESAFGATGPRATSFDTLYWEDGDGSEFNRLVADGLSILVTGLTDKTGRQLAALRQKSAACGL